MFKIAASGSLCIRYSARNLPRWCNLLRASQANNITGYRPEPIAQQTYHRFLHNVEYNEEPRKPVNAAPQTGNERGTVSIRQLDRNFSLFEDKCQRNERVSERDFIKTFDTYTLFIKTIKEAGHSLTDEALNISLYTAILLRACGRLMLDTPPKGRELLAGNLWTFIKENKIPVDISHYNSLLRVLNENDTDYDPKKLLEEINEAKLVPDRVTYQRLIHRYCVQGNVNGATELLETMKNNDMELNETIFASLILGYSKQAKPPTATEIFNLMRSNNVEPGSRSYAAAFISLAARLEKDPKATDELKKTYELMKSDDIVFTIGEISDLLTHLSQHRDANETIAKLLDEISSNLSGSISARYRILATLLKVNQFEQASKIFWAQKMSERALETKSSGTYWVQAMARHHNVPVKFVIKECEKMKEKGYHEKAFHQAYFTAAESGRLDLVRASIAKMAEDELVKVQYFWPLLAQAKSHEEILEVLKKDLNPRMNTNDLMETFSQWVWPKFSDNVMQLFEHNKELGFDKNMLMASFLNYSVQEDKIVEAIKFVSEAPAELVEDTQERQRYDDDEPDITPRTGRSGERGSIVARLLNQIVEQTKDPELVKKAFNMCQLPDQKVSLKSLAALVRVHLVNNDFNTALEEFLRIAREYRLTPSRTELMQHCLVNKDPENLQKIMDVTTEIFGESNALYDLAVCCLQCNKLKQAQKIFASPGFRVRPMRVYQTSRTLARRNEVNVLENFVNLARDMYDINQEYLYQVLIDTYERTSNARRALNLWNMMQEEEFQPSKKSLLMIANILEKNNIDVPFQKPMINKQ